MREIIALSVIIADLQDELARVKAENAELKKSIGIADDTPKKQFNAKEFVARGF